MATREDLYTALRNADASGDAEGARKLAAYIQSMPAESSPAPGPAKSDAQMIGERSPSLVTTGANGPLFGFGDEIAGAVTATLKGIPGLDKGAEGTTWSQRYKGYRDVLRGQEDAYRKENPYKAAGVQVLTSIPTMAITAPAAVAVKGTGIAANALRAGLTGGASGAIAGAGNSQGNSLSEVAIDAAKGGAIGAAAGGVITPVAAGMGSIGNTAYSAFNEGAAANYAREKIAQQFARDGVTATQAANKLRALGPDATVAVSGNEAVLGALDALAQLPGQTRTLAKSVVAQTQKGRGARMIAAADEGLNAGGKRAAATVDALVESRSKEAKPLYDALYKKGVFINDELRGIIDAANKLGAGGEAKRVATAKQRDYSLTPETKWAGLRDLDYLKQGLDDIILASKKDGVPTKVTAAVQGLKNDLVGILDQETKGAYKVARDAYAGKSAVIDAVKEGRKALTQDDASIGSITAGMSASELEGFKVGAFEALRSKLGAQAGQTELMKLWRQDAMKEKLRAVFGDETAFLKFARGMHKEREIAKIESVVGGSPTMKRSFAAGDLDTSAIEAVGAASTANPLSMLGTASRVWNKVSTPENVRDAMGNMLLMRGQGGVNALTGMDEVIQNLAMRRNALAIRSGGALGVAANPITNLLR